MNGFLLSAATEGAGLDARRIAPVGAGEVVFERACPGDGALLAWGTQGDVHYAARGDVSLVILSGHARVIRLGMHPASSGEIASWLLTMFENASSTGDMAEIARGLSGSFGIVYRHFTRDVTFCVSDRLASRPLWRRWSGRGWAVSSHPMALSLSAESTSIDPVTLASFLLYGGAVVPTRSILDGVTALPPGTVARLGSSGIAEEHRWFQYQHRPDYGRSLDDWVNTAVGRLVEAASRLVPQHEQVALFFSGGVDSRLAAAALKAAGTDPLLITLGDTRNLEVRVAAAAAKALGLRQVTVLRDVHWYLRSLPRAVYETGGTYVFTHGHFSRAASEVRAEHGPHMFMLGDFCEAFSKLFCAPGSTVRRLWTTDEFVAAFDSLRLPLYRPGDRSLTVTLLHPAVRQEILAGVERGIGARYEELSAAAADPRVMGDYYFRWESAPTLPTFYMFTDLRAAAPERNLMFDSDVHDLLAVLPPEIRDRRNFGAALIRRLCRRAAWVPNSNSLLPMWWPPRAHALSRSIKPRLGRLRRALVGQSHRTTGSWPEHAVLYARDPSWRALMSAVLENGDLFDRQLFDRDAVRQCWRAFVQGDHRRAGDVEKLLQVGLTASLLQDGWSTFSTRLGYLESDWKDTSQNHAFFDCSRSEPQIPNR